MKKSLMVLAALALVSGGALAGPNSGGMLIVHSPGIAFTSDITDYCGMSPLDWCGHAVTRIDGPDAWVWKVYAAFPETSSPRLTGLTFGVTYDKADPSATVPDYEGLLILGFKMCGDFEITTANWPDPGEGTGMAWNVALTTNPTECYWFAGYNYSESYSGAPVAETFCLMPGPTQGGYFADDSVPAVLDEIFAYGCLGFDTDGSSPCNFPPPLGACCHVDCSCYLTVQEMCVPPELWIGGGCVPSPCGCPPQGACCDPATGLCTLEAQAQCLAPLVWLPGVTCDSNPCPPPVPTETTTWGQIKATYR